LRDSSHLWRDKESNRDVIMCINSGSHEVVLMSNEFRASRFVFTVFTKSLRERAESFETCGRLKRLLT
jgi:hypothetical protein